MSVSWSRKGKRSRQLLNVLLDLTLLLISVSTVSFLYTQEVICCVWGFFFLTHYNKQLNFSVLAFQPRHVPWLGIKPATFQIAGPHSIHWATRAMARNSFCKLSCEAELYFPVEFWKIILSRSNNNYWCVLSEWREMYFRIGA